MARRPALDPQELDRAAAIAEGRTPDNPDEREPGETDLTAPVAPDNQPPAPEEAPIPPVEEPEAEAPAKTVHTARQAIIERAKARKIEETTEAEPVAAEPAPEPDPVVPVLDRAAALPTKRKVKVDRVEREVGEEEYDTAARVGLALGNRLTELNQLLPQLRQLASQPPASHTPTDRDSPASPPADQVTARRTPSRVASLTDEKLDQIGEQLAYGEPEDRRAALRALVEEIGGPAVTVDDVVSEIEARNTRSSAMAEAGAEFAKRHRTIASDPDLIDLTTKHMQRVCIEEMRAIGVEEHVLAEAAADLNTAFLYHGDLRRQGYQLSEPDTVSDKAAKHVAQKFGIQDGPAPAPLARPAPTSLTPSTQRQITPAANRADREVEKEQMRQPRRAAMVARTPPAPQARSRDEVVRAMRQKRGFNTVA